VGIFLSFQDGVRVKVEVRPAEKRTLKKQNVTVNQFKFLEKRSRSDLNQFKSISEQEQTSLTGYM
jgi:hypothetical protein